MTFPNVYTNKQSQKFVKDQFMRILTILPLFNIVHQVESYFEILTLVLSLQTFVMCSIECKIVLWFVSGEIECVLDIWNKISLFTLIFDAFAIVHDQFDINSVKPNEIERINTDNNDASVNPNDIRERQDAGVRLCYLLIYFIMQVFTA